MARRKAGIGEELPEVNFSDYNGVRCLHLGTEWVQGSMKLDDPYEIELEYVQRMMAWLLFVEPTQVATRHAMQLWLGAGALTKFCRRQLRMKTTVIEIAAARMPPSRSDWPPEITIDMTIANNSDGNA